MARSGYPAEFRRRVLDLLVAGRHVGDVARDLGITDQAVYNWRHEGRIDRGLGRNRKLRCRQIGDKLMRAALDWVRVETTSIRCS